jgi:hypothetical protein
MEVIFVDWRFRSPLRVGLDGSCEALLLFGAGCVVDMA